MHLKEQFKKPFLILLVLLLCVSLVAPNNVKAFSKDDIGLNINGENGNINLTLDFKEGFRLNPEEKVLVNILNNDNPVNLNGESISTEPKEMILNSENNEWKFNISTSIEEDFIIKIKSQTFELALVVNASSAYGEIMYFDPFIDVDEPDYTFSKYGNQGTDDLVFPSSIKPGLVPPSSPEEAIKMVLKGEFDFKNEKDVNEQSIKAQVDRKIGENFQSEVFFDQEADHYVLNIWSTEDKSDLISKPLYINSEVEITFDDPEILEYSTLREGTPGSTKIENGALSVNDKVGITYSNVVLPIFNYGRDFTIEAEVVHNGGVSDSRWIAVSYGLKSLDENNNWTFWQMAMRKNAKVANGVEIANMPGNGTWDTPYKGPYKEVLVDEKPYTLTIVVEGGEVREYIDGELILKGPMTSQSSSGKVAFTYDRANAKLNNIKVSGEIPENLDKDFTIVDVENEYVRNIYQPKTNISIPPTVVSTNYNLDFDISGERRPATILLELNDKMEVVNKGDVKTIEETLRTIDRKAMVAFSINNIEQAWYLRRIIDNNNLNDVFVISENPEVTKDFSRSFNSVRGIIDLSKTEINKENLIDVVHKANLANTRIALIDETLATRENIEYIQSRGVLTWVRSSSEDRKIYDNILSGTYGLVIDEPLKALDAIESFSESDFGNILVRNPIVAAHRGFHEDIPFDMPEYGFKKGDNLPENSISSTKAAMGIFADAVESDLYLAKDGVIVVNHDGETKRLSLENVKVEDMTSTELANIKYKEKPDEGIPTLDEFIKVTLDSDIVHVMEIKSGKLEIVPELRKVLEANGIMDRTMIISFNKDILAEVRKVIPEVSVGVLDEYVPALAPNSVALKQLSNALNPLNAFYNNNFAFQNYNQVKFLNHRGILVHPWTINGKMMFEDMYAKNYHGITSNRPDFASFYLDKVYTEKTEYTEDELKDLSSILTAEYRNGEQKQVVEPIVKRLNIGSREGQELILLGETFRPSGSNSQYTKFTQTIVIKDGEEPTDPELPIDPEQPLDPENPIDPNPGDDNVVTPPDNDENDYDYSFLDSIFWTSEPSKDEGKNNIDLVGKDYKNHWAAEVIDYVLKKGYMGLDSKGNFNPEMKSNRYTIIKALGLIEKINPKDYMGPSLKDVSPNSEESGYINWAISKGIINGYEDGSFKADREITREEMAKILNRYVENLEKVRPLVEEISFKDQEKIGDWAKEDVAKAMKRGLMKGTDEGKFEPKGNIKRAELAQIIFNIEK